MVFCLTEIGYNLYTLFGDFDLSPTEAMLIYTSYAEIRSAIRILLRFFPWRYIIVLRTAARIRCCKRKRCQILTYYIYQGFPWPKYKFISYQNCMNRLKMQTNSGYDNDSSSSKRPTLFPEKL